MLLTAFRRETPIYYLMRSNREEAELAVTDIYKDQYVSKVLDEYTSQYELKQQSKQDFAQIFSPQQRRQTLVGSLLCVLQQFSGINCCVFYSTKIFKEVYADQATLFTIFNGFNLIIFAFVGGLFINRFGRKIILIGGTAMCGILLGVLSLMSKLRADQIADGDKSGTYNAFIVILIFLYCSSFGMSLGPITWIYLSQILSEPGVGFCTAINWLSTLIITLIFPTLSDYSLPLSFLIFASCCALGLVFLFTMVKETKGLTQVEIQRLFTSESALLGSTSDNA